MAESLRSIFSAARRPSPMARMTEGHRDRYIGSLFRVDEPVPVLLVQTVDISNDRQLTLFKSIFRRTHVKKVSATAPQKADMTLS